MKIHEYNEMMSYLTRPARVGFNQGTKKVAGLMEEYYGSDELKYQKAVKNGFQGTFEEYLQWMRKNAAYGGRIIGKPGGLVEPGVTHYATWETRAGNIVSDKKTKKFSFPSKNQHGKIVFRQEPAKPTTLLDKYQGMTDDYDLLVKESVRVNNGTNLPKSFKDYVNSYTFPDGTKATYQQYSGLASRSKGTKYRKSLKRPVDPINVKLTIMDNLITEANRGNKFVDLTTLAKKVDWTDKDISNYKRAGRIKKLETSSDKVDKVFKNLFNDLDAPLDNFFNPIYKMADETRLSRGVVSTLLNKNPDYTKKSARLIQTLGSYALQGKYAKEGLTIGQFLGDWENRLFIGENGLLSLKNYNKPVTSIVQDAWRQTSQGGTQIEWITPPKLDKKGDLISLADAQFKYTGPNGSDTIWSASGKTVNGIESKSISIYGKDAPEFKKVFQDYDDIFRLENEIKPHPVTGEPTKMIQIMKESYNIGKGSSFGTSSLARDHVDIIKDVFGNDPDYGTRIVPRRVNEYAGALKTINMAVNKGLDKNYTQAKIDKIYDTMGYNYTKSYDQILNDEYNLSKKIFNKWQAAGWELDANNRWVIKEGFDENIARSIDARGNPKNQNKILRSPFQIAEDIKLPRSKFVPIGSEMNLGTELSKIKNVNYLSPTEFTGAKERLTKTLATKTGTAEKYARVLGKDPILKQYLDKIEIKPTDTQKTILKKINDAPIPKRAKALLLPIVAGAVAITGADLMTSNLQAAELGQMPQGSPGQLSEDGEGLGLGEYAAIGTGTALAAKKAWKYALKPALKTIASPTSSALFSASSIFESINPFNEKFGKVKEDPNLTMAGIDLMIPDLVKRVGGKFATVQNVWSQIKNLGIPMKYAPYIIKRMTGLGIVLTGADVALGAKKFADQLDFDRPLTEEQRTDIQERKTAVPRMFDTYEQASKIAKEQGISYEDALKQLDTPNVPGINFNQGGRVGFDKGSPKSPKRRLVLKGIAAAAMIPIVGRFFKLGKFFEKAGAYTGPAIEKIKGMPDWLPSLVKRLWNEGEDVTKIVATGERQVVKRGTLEGGDDVDLVYQMDTGDVSINVTPKKGTYETSSGAFNKEYGLELKKGEQIATKKGSVKTKDEFQVTETEPVRTGHPEDPDWDWDGRVTTVDDAMSDLTELEAFAKNKSTKKIYKKKGTKPKDVNPEVDYPEYDYGDYDID